MTPLAAKWGKLVYPLLLHAATKVRDQAMKAMNIGMDALVKHQEELAKSLVPDLKAVSCQSVIATIAAY